MLQVISPPLVYLKHTWSANYGCYSAAIKHVELNYIGRGTELQPEAHFHIREAWKKNFQQQ